MKNSQKKIICTLGPSSLNSSTIYKLEEAGISLFRINLSHTALDQIEPAVRLIQSASKMPICLDSEGAQIRNGKMSSNSVKFSNGMVVELTAEEIVGDQNRIPLTPAFIVSNLRVGDLVSIDFNSLLLKVFEVHSDSVRAIVLCDGVAGSNKAVSLNRPIQLPALSPKDEKALQMGLDLGVEWFALSFANCREDVLQVRSLAKNKLKIISKIESSRALQNLREILGVTDAILIDRGDLSREEPVEKIPFLQKEIIRTSNSFKIPAFVATNLLESMVTQKKPTRAEVNDIINTLLDGASGLVLAAETAIGKHPVECVQMVRKAISYFERTGSAFTLESLQKTPTAHLSLPEPVGGHLVQSIGRQTSSLQKMSAIPVGLETLIDLEQLATGVYSPLTGFMTKAEMESVLANYRLPNGSIWTLPILLQVDRQFESLLKVGSTLALQSSLDQNRYGSIEVADVFEYDLDKLCTLWFGTNDSAHPGVSKLKRGGNLFVGGKVDLAEFIPSPYRAWILTPEETRRIFEHRGWTVVVGFHTRNIAHRAHEYLHRKTLERLEVSGLFIHPVIGPKKSQDYGSEILLKAYSTLIENHYPKDQVLLGAFHTYSRYAGPREAIFTALCRKNFGCSHFIVGRDHTGVGQFYAPDASQKLFNELGDIGITPIFFDDVYFCKSCGQHVETCEHGKKDKLDLSATSARDFFRSGKLPPEQLMRPDISSLISKALEEGREVFIP